MLRYVEVYGKDQLLLQRNLRGLNKLNQLKLNQQALQPERRRRPTTKHVNHARKKETKNILRKVAGPLQEDPSSPGDPQRGAASRSAAASPHEKPAPALADLNKCFGTSMFKPVFSPRCPNGQVTSSPSRERGRPQRAQPNGSLPPCSCTILPGFPLPVSASSCPLQTREASSKRGVGAPGVFW